MTLGDRMNDFAFEVISEGEETPDEASKEIPEDIERKLDDLLAEIRKT
jgi:hypothetical protein